MALLPDGKYITYTPKTLRHRQYVKYIIVLLPTCLYEDCNNSQYFTPTYLSHSQCQPDVV